MDWKTLLHKAIKARGSQAAVAAELGYSPATISLALAGNYSGNMDAIKEKILARYGGKSMEQEIPEGYKKNNLGHLVPIETIKDIDLARDDFVREAAEEAKALAESVAMTKRKLSEDMAAFLDLSSEKYGVRMGGRKGNINLMSFDGKYKLSRDISERLEFDERLQTAKALIDECLREWTKDAGAEVRALIDNAFQVDKKGRINSRRILGLRRLEITHPKWLKAMEAIGDAVIVAGSCQYFRIYERDEESGEYRQICLDFSAA